MKRRILIFIMTICLSLCIACGKESSQIEPDSLFIAPEDNTPMESIGYSVGEFADGITEFYQTTENSTDKINNDIDSHSSVSPNSNLQSTLETQASLENPQIENCEINIADLDNENTSKNITVQGLCTGNVLISTENIVYTLIFSDPSIVIPKFSMITITGEYVPEAVADCIVLKNCQLLDIGSVMPIPEQ